MKKAGIIVSVFVLFFSIRAVSHEINENKDWKLCVQSYTFHQYNFSETLDKIKSLGVNYVEVWFGQKLGGGLEGKMDYNDSKELRDKILAMAKERGVKIIACGVVVCDSNEEWDKVFSFAHYMGIKVITCEPKKNQLEYVDSQAEKYGIKMAVHNHPKPSLYWNPEYFMKEVSGLSHHIGSCSDVGHWNRMGIKPLEALKTCKGRVLWLHFKDVDKEGSDSKDTIWGEGVCNVKGMMKELKKQNFKGFFSIEYETEDSPQKMKDIRKSIAYFYKTENEI